MLLPERVNVSGPFLRRWEASDAALALDAIAASRLELERWTPWVIPQPFEVTVLEERLRSFHTQFETGPNFIYGLFDESGERVLGQAGLYDRIGPGILEVGYWIRSDATGRGYARRASAVLIDLAFRTRRVERVQIRCDPENVPSAAIPQRLGFTLREVLKLDAATSHGAHELQVWELLAGEYQRDAENRYDVSLAKSDLPDNG